MAETVGLVASIASIAAIVGKTYKAAHLINTTHQEVPDFIRELPLRIEAVESTLDVFSRVLNSEAGARVLGAQSFVQESHFRPSLGLLEGNFMKLKRILDKVYSRERSRSEVTAFFLKSRDDIEKLYQKIAFRILACTLI